MQSINDLKQVLNQNQDAITVNAPNKPAITLSAKQLYDALPTQMYTTAGVNLRKTPGLAGTIVQTISFRAAVDVYTIAPVELDGYKWHNVRYGNAVGWVADKYLSLTAPSNISPLKLAPGFGLHVFPNGNSAGVLEMAKRLYNAGKPLACATVVNRITIGDNILLVNELVKYIKYVIYRDVPSDGNPDNPKPEDYGVVDGGYRWMSKLWPRYMNLDPRVYIQPANECAWFEPNGQFWVDAMRFAENQGRRLAIFADAVGNPANDQYSTPLQKWQSRGVALKRAREKGHVVALHVYSAPNTPAGQLSDAANLPFFEARAVNFYNNMPEEARPVLIFTEAAGEFARGRFQGVTECVNWHKAFYNLVKPLGYVAGWCAWTVGGGGWQDASIDSALPALEDFARNL